MAAVLTRLADYGLPCLIVDDGSDASTAEELQSLAADRPWVRLMRLDKNQGKGAAVIAGLQLAQRQGYSHALQVDADGQHQLSDIPAMIDEARAHPGLSDFRSTHLRQLSAKSTPVWSLCHPCLGVDRNPVAVSERQHVRFPRLPGGTDVGINNAPSARQTDGFRY